MSQLTVQVQPDAPATPGTTPAPEAKPTDLILGKFKTQDDLVKAYTALEQKQSQQALAVETPTTPAPTPEAKPADKLGTNFQVDQYAQEFAKTGQLSDSSYKELEAKGFPKQIVDTYIEGQRAKAQAAETQAKATVYSVAGSEQAYGEMVLWAASGGLSDVDTLAYNNTLNNGSSEQVKLAVEGLKARYDKAFGRDPQLANGHAVSAGPKPFRSNAEVTTAMKDPRYKTDEAYRSDVSARMAVSFNS